MTTLYLLFTFPKPLITDTAALGAAVFGLSDFEKKKMLLEKKKKKKKKAILNVCMRYKSSVHLFGCIYISICKMKAEGD